jgi:protein polybromo-1
MFELFDQTRSRSYFESNPNNSKNTLSQNKFKIHRFSQLYKDACELQRYFMQKRDELCRNGELLNSPALSFKLTALEAHIASSCGTFYSAANFDENDALFVEERFRPLENDLKVGQKSSSIQVGNFYWVSRELVKSGLTNKEDFVESKSDQERLIICVLAYDNSHLIGQVYLKPDDEFVDANLRKTRKFFHNEILRSDLYTRLDIKKVESELVNNNCLVIGIKQHISFDAHYETVKNEESSEDSEKIVNVKPEDIFVCESMYSTCFKYFRKLGTKKWTPVGFVTATVPDAPNFNFTFVKRINPLNVNRLYLDQPFVDELVKNVC